VNETERARSVWIERRVVVVIVVVVLAKKKKEQKKESEREDTDCTDNNKSPILMRSVRGG